MLLPESFSAALVLMLFSVACWGSWPNTYRLSRGWRLEFYHFDHPMGVVLVATLVAVTLGRAFGGPTFLDDLREAQAVPLVCAAIGGMCLNIGNFLLMAGVARVGMAIAFPVSVGFALVVSTVLSYWIHPVGDPVLLGGGVALVFCAVLTNSLVSRADGARGRTGSRTGLAMCLVSGMLFSAAGPLVAKALAPPRPLAPYGTALVYALGALAATVPLLLVLKRRPLGGMPLRAEEYAAGSVRNHVSGLLGGTIWGAGMVASFVAAGYVGMAVAGAVGQANPLVAALWGIVVWKEFRGASRRTHMLLALMIALYSAGLLLLGLSFGGK